MEHLATNNQRSTGDKRVSQKARINDLRLLSICFVSISMFLDPLYSETIYGESMYFMGVFCVIFSVLGRCWSIMHIGTYKNVMLIQTGPYSICRHPLYLFSIVAALGFALLLQSLVLSAVFASSCYYVFRSTIREEEQYLDRKFPASYRRYRIETAQLLPLTLATRGKGGMITAEHCKFRKNLIPYIDTIFLLALVPISHAIAYVREVLGSNILVVH